MAATTYECSECGALLKSPQELAAGKKIRCPKCSKVFTVGGAAAAAPAAAGKASPAAAAGKAAAPPARPKIDEDEDEGGSYIFKEDNSAPSPTDAELNRGNKKKRDDDEDEDDDLDDSDRPKKKKKKGSKKKKAGSGGGSGSKVVLIIAGVLVLLLLGSAGGGAYVYLNWYKNKGTGNEDPLAMMPPECAYLVYINSGTISSHPGGASFIELMTSEEKEFYQNIKTEVGLDPKDLMDQLWIGMIPREGANPAEPTVGCLVFKSKVPFDQNKMRLAFKESTHEKVGLRSYYRVKTSKGHGLAYMPSDYMLVLTEFPEPTLIATIRSKQTAPSLSSDLLSMAQSMEKNDAWAVGKVDTKLRQELKGNGGVPIPQGVEEGIEKAKAFGFGAAIAGGQVKINAMVDCGNDASAKRFANEIDTMWTKNKGQIGLIASIFGKSAPTLAKEFTQTLQISSRGTSSQASAQVSFDALKNVLAQLNEMGKAAPGQQQQGGARMGNRGPGPAGLGGPGGRPIGPGGRRGGRGGDR